MAVLGDKVSAMNMPSAMATIIAQTKGIQNIIRSENLQLYQLGESTQESMRIAKAWTLDSGEMAWLQAPLDSVSSRQRNTYSCGYQILLCANFPCTCV